MELVSVLVHLVHEHAVHVLYLDATLICVGCISQMSTAASLTESFICLLEKLHFFERENVYVSECV